MQERVNTSINEFQNEGYNKNIAKFIDHHDKLEDIHVTFHTQDDRATHQVPNQGKSRAKYFESAKGNAVPLRTVTMENETLPDKNKNFAAAFVEKSLVKLPSNISEKKELLTVLDLSKNKFEYFPLEISQFVNLRVLRLDYNKIKCIPGEIYKLTKLEILSMAHNSLQTLPSTFSKLTSLKEVNIQSNLLEIFPEEITALKGLTFLNIVQNKLAWFPSSFKNLTNLTELHFEWFKYTKPAMTQFQKGKDGEEVIKRLLWKCAELAEKNIKGMSFLEFIEYFSTHPVNLYDVDVQERTILHTASIYDDISVIRYLISNAPDLIDRLDKDNNTAFCTAILKDKFYAARYLLKHGANPTKGGGIHGSALHIATKKLSYTLVSDILMLGENPNRIDADGNTPLHHAIVLMAEGHHKGAIVTQVLLEQGANPNPKNKENWTPMHLAVRRRCPKTLSWIINYNSELEEVRGREEIFKMNKRGGAYKWTAMHIAAYAGVPELVQILGDAGVDMFKRSVNGYTPKRVVNKYGATLKLLEKYEKIAIKNKLFKKKDQESDAMDGNLVTLSRPREIKGASKNKFGENAFAVNDNEPENYGVFGFFFKSKAYMFNSQYHGAALHKQLLNESQEVSPELETEIDEDLFEEDDQDTARLDFCTEINEDVSVGVKNMAKTSSTAKSNGEKMNAMPGKIHHRQMKSKSDIHFQQNLTIDINSYEKQLKTQAHFDLNFCKSELKFLKENITSDRLVFTDKLKILLHYRILHKIIIDHVYKHFIIPVPHESFPYYVLKENLGKGNNHTGQLKNGISQNTQAIYYYELVPQHLLQLYPTISNSNFEGIQLKIQIIRLFTEFLYFPAIDLLDTITSSSEEEFIVKVEAKRQMHCLKSLLDPEIVKANLGAAANKAIKMKLYGNMPTTKTKLNPIKRLEKNESIFGIQRDELV